VSLSRCRNGSESERLVWKCGVRGSKKSGSGDSQLRWEYISWKLMAEREAERGQLKQAQGATKQGSTKN